MTHDPNEPKVEAIAADVERPARKRSGPGNPNWIKGVSGNLKGGPITPEEVKELRRINRETVPVILDKFMAMDRGELARVANDPSTPALELILIKVITEAIKTGDHQRLGFLFDRIMGKQPEQVNVMGVHLSIVKALQSIEGKVEED